MADRRRALAQFDTESDLRLERTCARLAALTVVKLGPKADEAGSVEPPAAAEPGPGPVARHGGEHEWHEADDDGGGHQAPPAARVGRGGRVTGNRHTITAEEIVQELAEHNERVESTRRHHLHEVAVVLTTISECEERSIVWGGFARLLEEFQESFHGGPMGSAASIRDVIMNQVEEAANELHVLKQREGYLHDSESGASGGGDRREHRHAKGDGQEAARAGRRATSSWDAAVPAITGHRGGHMPSRASFALLNPRAKAAAARAVFGSGSSSDEDGGGGLDEDRGAPFSKAPEDE